MNDHDPIVMYVVVRRILNLSPGKVGSQCGHAVHYLCRAAFPERWPTPEEVDLRSKSQLRPEAMTDEERAKLAAFDEANDLRSRRLADFREWDRSPEHTKITLGADDAEFARVQTENDHFMVTDLGHTEVDPNTQTCLGLWPMRKSARTRTLKRLRLL